MDTRKAAGVPIGELRAAVALARQNCTAGVEWSPAEWERIWVRMTERQQHVVYLHIVVGLNLTAVAEQLGLSRGAVNGAWRRALARIRDALPVEN